MSENGATPLLKTKLQVPVLPSHYVKRGRLIDQLVLRPETGFILVTAPPGFGKSTLIADWCRSMVRDSGCVGGTDNATPLTAWISIDERDNDPARFWSYVYAGLNAAPFSSGVEFGKVEYVPGFIGPYYSTNIVGSVFLQISDTF